MNPSISESIILKRLALAASILAVIFAVYTIVSSVIIHQQTGVLKVTSTDPKATISISQNNKQAAVIGTGSSSARLKPGVYRIVANNGSGHAFGATAVFARRTSDILLSIGSSSYLRTSADVSFVGTNVLVDHGLSANQLYSLKKSFFSYNNKAKEVKISNVKATPHKRDSASTYNSMTFDVTIDGKEYTAKIEYSGLSDGAQLYLYDNFGTQVFDSGPAPEDPASSGG